MIFTHSTTWTWFVGIRTTAELVTELISLMPFPRQFRIFTIFSVSVKRLAQVIWFLCYSSFLWIVTGELIYDLWQVNWFIVSETVGYVTHVTKIMFNLCQMEAFKKRSSVNAKTLVDLYRPNFSCDTRLGTIHSRLQTCHNHYYRSFTSGIPGLSVCIYIIIA